MEPRICEDCGNMNDDNAKFCERCGTPVKTRSRPIENAYPTPISQISSNYSFQPNNQMQQPNNDYSNSQFNTQTGVSNSKKMFKIFAVSPCLLFLGIMIIAIMNGEGSYWYNLGISIDAAIVIVSICFYPILWGVYNKYKGN